MDNKERLRRAAVGQQNSSLEYVKYYCLCDCITLNMSESYTAMGAGLELFLDKFQPGEKYIQPFAMKLETGKTGNFRPLAFKTPKRIDVFLWSPFHEALSTYWDVGDDCRHSYRFKGQLLRDLRLAKKIEDPTVKEFKQQLRLMEKKVNRIWDRPQKILIFYEHSRLREGPAREKLELYNRLSQKILKWPVVQMKLTQYDGKDKTDKPEKCWWGWEHYAKETRKLFFNEIKQLAGDTKWT